VPKRDDLEDTILDWLDTDDSGETPASQPRIISMPKEEREPGADGRRQGPIRRKSTESQPGKTGSDTQR
jgi:hypothetical protein